MRQRRSGLLFLEIPVVAWGFAQILRKLERSLPKLRFVAFDRPVKFEHMAPAAQGVFKVLDFPVKRLQVA